MNKHFMPDIVSMIAGADVILIFPLLWQKNNTIVESGVDNIN
jgi:arginine repressor